MQHVLARISLSRIRENARLLKKRANTALFAVVKDEAYGHGGAEAAHALNGIAEAFCVATVKEGAALRIAGIREPVLVFCPPLESEDAFRMRAYALTATLSSPRSLELIAEAGLNAHLAVNTGMNRCGVPPSRAEYAARRAKMRGIKLTGVYSHLWAAQIKTVREEQLALFLHAAEGVKKYFPEAKRHLAATGGILAGSAFCLDAVRPGIGLYGYLPQGFEGALAVKPAVKLYAPVSHTCRRVGGGAGYRAAGEGERFYTLRMGYGDGFFRANGALCMDACVKEGSARIGTYRRILQDIPAYARENNTTEYEVLLRVLQGAEKHYDR